MSWLLIFCALCLSWIVPLAVTLSACPQSCRCLGLHARGVQVDCSNRAQDTVPQNLSSQTITLDLSQNNISSVGPDDFVGLTRLIHLDLSTNNIELIYDRAFRDLKNLKKLYLKGNYLIMNDILQQFAFKYLANLEVLDIKYNVPLSRERGYPGKMWQYFKNLKELYIDGISSSFGDDFLPLRNLHTLSLSGVLCETGMITRNTFKGLRQCPIRKLDLEGCGIRIFDGQAFQHIPGMTWLSLADNRLDKTVLQMAKGFSLLSLKHLDLSRTNVGDFLYPLIHDHLCGSTLKSLIVTSGTIYKLGDIVSKCLPDLEVFSCSNNENFLSYPYTYIQDVGNLLNMSHIKELNMSSHHQNCDQHDEKIHRVRANDDIQEPLMCHEHFPISLSSSLEVVDLSFNGISLPLVPQIVFQTPVNVQVFRAVHAGIAALYRPVYCRNIITIGEIDVRNNILNYVHQDAFSKCDWSSLVKLKLGGNMLAGLLDAQEHEPFFKPLVGLQVRQRR